MVKICVDCKKFVPTSATVCPLCGGKNLVVANVPASSASSWSTSLQQPATVPAKKKKKRSKAPYIAFLLIFVVAIGAVILTQFLNPCKNGHTWKAATCEDPKTCSVCGRTDGNSLGHDWEGATCTQAGICSRCGKEGYKKSHQYSKGFCTSCGRIEEFYKSSEETDGDDYFAAIAAAKIVVKDKLKSPSSAKFPISDSEYVVEKAIGENDWVVSGYVDAQNGFGAMIRTIWIASFTLGPEIRGEQKITDVSVVFP